MRKRVILFCLLIALCLTACGKKNDDIQNADITDEVKSEKKEKKSSKPEKQEEKEESEETKLEVSEEAESEAEEQLSVDPKPEEEDEEVVDIQGAISGFSFADLETYEFCFSSGAGAWSTLLWVEADGSFSGSFHDSDMGDSSPEYPEGTVYFSEFNGQFTNPKRIDDDTYAVQIAQLSYKNEFGEEIIDNVRYVYTDAYGLTDAEDIYIYLPGTELSKLPEDYRYSIGFFNWNELKDTLPYYGLYNVSEGCGFFSYNLAPSTSYIESKVQETEELVANLERKIMDEENAPTQMDYNITSGEIYEAWDALLNEIWAQLQNTLDEESMTRLKDEQRQWIADKEKAVEEAAQENEGGSLEPFIRNSVASDWTSERVYELLEYL